MNTTLVNLRTTVNSATHEGHRDLLLQKPRWRATSHDIDAQDIKHHLQELGFADHEFQIRMEFQRAWGCL